MTILSYNDHTPRIESSVFIAPDAWIIGNVTIGPNSSVFFGACLRGDVEEIVIGEKSNIQEYAILHTSTGAQGVLVGDRVTVGHRAILHSCTIGNGALIGMSSTIMDGAQIGENAIVGANSLVTMNTNIPPGSLAMGSPAKVIRELTKAELEELRLCAPEYVGFAQKYKESKLLADQQ